MVSLGHRCEIGEREEGEREMAITTGEGAAYDAVNIEQYDQSSHRHFRSGRCYSQKH